MTTRCEQLEQALLSDDAAALETLAGHVDACDACREKAELWRRVEAAAPSLREEWESPELRARIGAAATRRPGRSLWIPLGIAAAVGAYAVAGWLSLQNPVPFVPEAGLLESTKERLLSDDTLKDVEKKEAAFVASIDVLERRAQPALQASSTPLLASLRERLVLIDSAIDDCRREIAKNELNTNLRRELLAMYQEKKQTLSEIVKETGDRKS